MGIKDLNVRGMVKRRRLTCSIADMCFLGLQRPLQYKAAMRGRLVVVADHFYPSSKTCSGCGY